jgi:glutathione S-transferase
MTIADISAACELDQSRFIALDLTKWPKVKAWLHYMIEETPEMLESA